MARRKLKQKVVLDDENLVKHAQTLQNNRKTILQRLRDLRGDQKSTVTLSDHIRNATGSELEESHGNTSSVTDMSTADSHNIDAMNPSTKQTEFLPRFIAVGRQVFEISTHVFNLLSPFWRITAYRKPFYFALFLMATRYTVEKSVNYTGDNVVFKILHYPVDLVCVNGLVPESLMSGMVLTKCAESARVAQRGVVAKQLPIVQQMPKYTLHEQLQQLPAIHRELIDAMIVIDGHSDLPFHDELISNHTVCEDCLNRLQSDTRALRMDLLLRVTKNLGASLEKFSQELENPAPLSLLRQAIYPFEYWHGRMKVLMRKYESGMRADISRILNLCSRGSLQIAE